MNDLINSVINSGQKNNLNMQNPQGGGFSTNVGGYGNLSFQNEDIYKQFQQNPQNMIFSQGPGVRYVEPKPADYDTRFQKPELPQQNDPGMSVNVGGYGNLIFKDNAAFEQFQQNPQNMTFSQGPGGARYVQPQNLDENFKMQQMQNMQPGLLPYLGNQ